MILRDFSRNLKFYGKKPNNAFFMEVVMKTFTGLICLLMLSLFIFTTCESPMGMGDSIDWEAPVLTMDLVKNPYIVRNGAKLSGTVKDNIGVKRVVLIDTATGRELLTATINGDRWEMNLTFSKDDNSKKISAQVAAYDAMGNCGAESIARVTLIVDIRPPIIDGIEIKRTDSGSSRLETYANLKKLETEDPKGEKKNNKYKWQNGWFYVNGIVNDDETKIETIQLKIYDYDPAHPERLDHCLVIKEIESTSTKYFPRWLVKEEEIIKAGDALWPGYENDYYVNEKRYYYQVVVEAVDSSNNMADIRQETEGFICMWVKSDEPKGILDSSIGSLGGDSGQETEKEITISRGTPLPIDFFDDDSIAWAYAGLLTKDQWIGVKPIGSSNTITGSTDEDRIKYIKKQLVGGSDAYTDIGTGTSAQETASFYNWKYDKYSGQAGATDAESVIKNYAFGKGGKLDETLEFVKTGNTDKDYGDYVLFTITADYKLPPHPSTPPAAPYNTVTNTNGWSYRIYRIKIIDENSPLIVFDTQNGSPEENTFPKLDGTGTYFTIKGYTLRENGGGQNGVTTFRMAWIPKNIPGGADSQIKAVKDALSSDSGYPTGVQHWEFSNVGTGVAKGEFNTSLSTAAANSNPETNGSKNDLKPFYADGATSSNWYANGSESRISGGTYRKQAFEKKFYITENTSDDVTSEYKNFTSQYNDGKLENDTKVFVFYAQDTMGHEVYRELRLLGMKTPPQVTIKDVTNALSDNDFPLIGGVRRPPDPNTSGYPDTINGGFTTAYYNALNDFNRGTGVFAAIKGKAGDSKSSDSKAFQMYPRNTILKYYISVDNTGDIAVTNITIQDITVSDADNAPYVGTIFNITDKAISFCEYYPDVSQRTFLIIATDALGNEARIQRTIAVTNAARLENITTTKQSGTYGIGETITLRANFSGQIYVKEGVPRINVHYKVKVGALEEDRYRSIMCKNTPRIDGIGDTAPKMYLEADFKVEENFVGELETLHGGMSVPATWVDGNVGENKPISLPVSDPATEIMDLLRKGQAFIPGYTSDTLAMPNWEDDVNCLQANKDIMLDGVRPTIILTAVDASGKLSYGGTPNVPGTTEYYLKTGESVNITISNNESKKTLGIRAKGAPRIQYYIRDESGTERGPFNAAAYYKPGGSANALIFNLPVNSDICKLDGAGSTVYDGEIIRLSLYAPGNVTGIVDNNADNDVGGATSLNMGTTRIFIKQKKPLAPSAKLKNQAIGSLPDQEYRYNSNGPNLPFEITASTAEFNSTIPWEDTTEYSLNGGLLWQTYTAKVETITNDGKYTLKARYKDRAGNEGAETTQKIDVNVSFPRLVSVSAEEPNGYYTQGKKLRFNLNFANVVTLSESGKGSTRITLSNRSTSNTQTPSGTGTSYEISLTASLQKSNTTIQFEWSSISGKEMRDGLYVTDVSLAGLTDDYGNSGPTGNCTFAAGDTGTNPVINMNPGTHAYTSPNLPAGIKVDAIAPALNSKTPDHNNAISSGDDSAVTSITLRFNEPVMKGSGTIQIRPSKNYAIPAVINDSGYYLDTSGNISYTSGTNKTYISSFYDIYNNSALTAAQRNALTKGRAGASETDSTQDDTNPSMTRLLLNERTGQSAGPYIKTTQGLVEGKGYTGNYSGTYNNGPSPEGNYMIPDTATKWVLDFKYGTTDDITVVNNIRAALTAAKWRWQEIEVVSTSVVLSNNDTVATITLPEPLLKGLQWDVYYPAGTFTDKAGNPALASTGSNGVATDYTFTTPGVQPPVVRVNRRSFDARTSDWKLSSNRTYSAPNNDTWNNDTTITDSTGWGINNFNKIHFRVDSESQKLTGYSVVAKSHKGAGSTSTTVGSGTVLGGWLGNVQDTTSSLDTPDPNAKNSNNRSIATKSWTAAREDTKGSWVLNNLIWRSRNNNDQTYTVTTKAGTTETRISKGNFRGFRSYNRDIDKTTLTTQSKGDTVTLTSTKYGQSALDFDPLEANKSYVSAFATLNGVTECGYEGIFRTVIMMNDPRNSGNNSIDTTFLLIEGSNIKNGMPSIAGFPVRDAEETGDNRFIKVFYRPANTQYYWVSTEIVDEWYFLFWGYNNSHMQDGEVNNYMTVGYGDLTYGYGIRSY